MSRHLADQLMISSGPPTGIRDSTSPTCHPILASERQPGGQQCVARRIASFANSPSG
jgi:hypothetical protein